MGLGVGLSSISMAAVFLRVVPYPLATVLSNIVNIYVICIVVWALLSWFRGHGRVVYELHQALGKIVEPYVKLFRRFIPVMGGMDFSPLVAMLVMEAVAQLILNL